MDAYLIRANVKMARGNLSLTGQVGTSPRSSEINVLLETRPFAIALQTVSRLPARWQMRTWGSDETAGSADKDVAAAAGDKPRLRSLGPQSVSLRSASPGTVRHGAFQGDLAFVAAAARDKPRPVR